MARIFLSYRRDDSAGFAGRLADAMEAEFGTGSVFRDVDDIRPGEDFIHAIESHLQQVGVVLVMIGTRWLDAGADGRRRLDDTGDFVRQEIQAALESGKPLIPLLVGGASMPAEADLPAAISGLSRRQAVVLSDSNWRGDVERLVASLSKLLPDEGVADHKRRWMLGLAGAVVGLAALVWNTNPGLAASQVRARILDGVDRLADLSGKIFTAGRINAYNSLLNIPAPPSRFAVSGASDSQVVLGWDGNYSDAVSVKIERRDAAQGAFVEIARVAPGTSVYRDTSVQASTTYSYRARASNGPNDSVYTSEISATAVSSSSGGGGGGGGGGCFLQSILPD